MILKQRLGRYVLAALVGISLSAVSGGIASATSQLPDSGGGDIARLRISGTCGDQLDLRLRTVGGPLKVAMTIPSADPTEQWTITATEQDYGVATGGRIGNPTDLFGSGLLPPPTYNPAEGGFSTEGFVPIPSGLTHGFSYVATRTSPTAITCTNTGYWTAPPGSSGPTVQNPVGKPNSAPALTGATEANTGANDAALQFDQEMLTTAQGTPDLSRFSITVDGVARTVTDVTIINDSPPARAIVDITFDGEPLTSGQTVAVLYRQPLTGGTPALQDMDGLTTASFGPISVPVF